MKGVSDGSVELAEAAAPIFVELERLRGEASRRVAPMLVYIRDHIFDRDLSVQGMKEGCGYRDNSVALYFHQSVGEPPGSFITERRIRVAQRLLLKTWLPIWKIADLLGYSSIQVFSRAFHRCRGCRPSAYRRDSPVESAPPAGKGAGSSAMASGGNADLLDRALAGLLDGEEAAELVRQLLELYPPRGRHVGSRSAATNQREA